MHSESDIELLFAHMSYTGKMTMETVGQESAELKMCKLAGPSNSLVEKLSQKEKADFSLTQNMRSIEDRISDYNTKI